MPPRRLQASTGLGPVTLRPVASPVDTYVRPGDQKLAQLAEGLSAFVPSLARLSDVMAEKDAAAQKAEGEQQMRMLIEEGKTYKQAIKEGLIRPDQSPWFRYGASQFAGENSASRYSADLESAVVRDLGESTQLADFDEFEREFRKTWLEENVGDGRSTAFESGFAQVDNQVAGIRRNFGVQSGARVVQQAGEEVHQRVMTTALEIAEDGVSPQVGSGRIGFQMQRAIEMGMDPATVNRKTVEAVVNAAMRTNDKSLLALLDHVRTGSGTLGATSYAAAAIEAAGNQIDQDRATQWSRDRQMDEVAEEDTVNELLSGVVSTLLEDPTADLEPVRAQLLAMGRHQEALDLANVRNSVNLGKVYTPPQAVAEFGYDIWTGRLGRQGLIGLLGDRTIDMDTFTYLNNQIQTQENIASQRGGVSLQDAAFSTEAAQQEMRNLSGVFDVIGAPNEETKVARSRGILLWEQQWWDYYHNQGGKEQPFNVQRQRAAEIGERVRMTVTGEQIDATGNPLGPPWETRPVITQGSIRSLVEWYDSDNPGPPSPSLVQALLRHGVDPRDPSAVEKFINAQKAFLR